MNFTPNNPFWMYTMESEGRDDLITTRTARINAVIRDVRNHPDQTIDEGTFNFILQQHGFTGVESLSDKEIRNILYEVRNK